MAEMARDADAYRRAVQERFHALWIGPYRERLRSLAEEARERGLTAAEAGLLTAYSVLQRQALREAQQYVATTEPWPFEEEPGRGPAPE
jgi:hypothetical protein